jgi:methyl-accepting chemotaxis protein
VKTDPASRGRSLRWRLSWLVLSTTAAALFVAALGFSAYEVVEFRRELAQHVAILGDVAARNGASSLLFDDALSAEATLDALRADAGLMRACFYDRRGLEFAATARPGVARGCPPISDTEGGFAAGAFRFFQPVVESGERIGWIYLEADTSALTARLAKAAGILLIVLAGSCAAALFLAARLQRSISDPIVELVATASAIAEGDLSTPVRLDADGEIGLLAHGFADMAERLRAVVGRVRVNTSAVSEVIGALRASSEQTLDDARAQEHATTTAVDSIGRMSRSIEEVYGGVATLSQEAQATSSSISQVAASSGDVAHQMDDLSASIEESASAMTQTSANLDSIASNVETLQSGTYATASSLETLHQAAQQVGRNAGESQEIADRTASEAGAGVGSMRETVSTMTEIRETFDRIQEAVGGLSQKSEAIGGIVRVINEVSQEIGMLALNADIIAAQAGQHGKAFSVVAQQVKSLAQRTSRSADEIGALVRRVQTETDDAVQSVGAGSKRVEEGVQRSREAGEMLGRISSSAQISAQMAREIATATDAQGAEIRIVDEAMAKVHAMVDQIRESTVEQGRAGRGITETVERIRDLGQNVKRLMQVQARDADVIEAAFEKVVAMIQQSLEATDAHKIEGERAERTLTLFRETAEAGTARAAELSRMVATLSARSQELEDEVARFRV